MSLNLTNPSLLSTGFLQDALGNNVLFALSNISSQGSGNINAFLRLQGASGSSVERGYNTNGAIEFDTLKQPSSKAITRNQLPAITIDGQVYREFRIDLNESNSNPTITLEKLQIFYSNSSTLTGYNSTTSKLGGLSPVVNLNSQIDPNDRVLLNAALNSGSGAGDVLVYIPDSVLGSGNPYVYIYSEFSGAESGFEEFSYGTSSALGSFADLSLTKTFTDTSSNTPLLVNDLVDFTLTVTNTAIAGLPSTTATGVQVKDLLPTGFAFVTALENGTVTNNYNFGTGIWNVGSISVGSSRTLTIRAKALDTGTNAAAYTNTAEIIASNQFDPDSAPNNGILNPPEDDQASVVASPIKLSLQKSFITSAANNFALQNQVKVIDINNDGTPEAIYALPGETIQFQLTVTNSGFGILNNVVLYDNANKGDYPVELTNLTITGLTDVNAAPDILEVNIGSLFAGQSKTFTVTAKVSDANLKPIDFTATLGATNPNTNQFDSTLPEYHQVNVEGRYYLHTDFVFTTDAAGRRFINFKYLNIKNQAEVRLNGSTAATSNEVQLDVSPVDLQGTLNNGQPLNIFSVDLPDSVYPSGSNVFNPPPIYAFTFDPDLFSKTSGTSLNQSEFIPPGQVGGVDLEFTWFKPSDPNFDTNYAVWKGLPSGTIAERNAALDFFIDRFIETGVGARALFDRAVYTVTNLSDPGKGIAQLDAQAGEFTPSIPASSTSVITVSDTGATVNGATYTNLQTALNSLSFNQPTGIKIKIVDTDGDGTVQTVVQTLNGNYNFAENWVILEIDSSITNVTFTSGNGKADYDFSSIEITNPNTLFTLQGDNAIDRIIGTQNNDIINGRLGSDYLDGYWGNDVLIGENGPDTFVLRSPAFGVDTIQDFNLSNDKFGLASGLTFNALQFAYEAYTEGGVLKYRTRIYIESTGESIAYVLGVDLTTLSLSALSGLFILI